jgi:hypothetical protein
MAVFIFSLIKDTKARIGLSRGFVNGHPSTQGLTVSTLDKPLRLLSEINERKNKKYIVEVLERLNSSISSRRDYSWNILL